MKKAQKRLIDAIESVALQVLDGNKGRSNRKTSIFHGAFEDYIKSKRKGIRWKHEEKIERGDRKFNLDMLAAGDKGEIALLLKNPMRSMGKNKFNSLVTTWGEGIRISLIRNNPKKPLSVLWVTIYPTTDISVIGKTAKGTGKAKLRKDYEAASINTHNAGLDLINSVNTRYRYVGIPFDYAITPTLKTISGIQGAFKSIEAGKRIIITEKTWQDIDDAIDWLLEGL